MLQDRITENDIRRTSERRRTSTCVDVRRRTSTYVDVRRRTSTFVDVRGRMSTNVDVRRRTWTYVDVHVRRRTSTFVDVRRRTWKYVDGRRRRKSSSSEIYFEAPAPNRSKAGQARPKPYATVSKNSSRSWPSFCLRFFIGSAESWMFNWTSILDQ